jgi:hypothetical protein
VSDAGIQIILKSIDDLKNDIRLLHDKTNSTNLLVAEMMANQKNDKFEIDNLKEKHSHCDGKKAMEILIEKRGEEKIKETKSFKVGEMILYASIVVSLIVIIVNFGK